MSDRAFRVAAIGDDAVASDLSIAPGAGDVALQALLAVESATEAGVTLSAAESCTGGLVCAAITEVPGSSAAFSGGVISYDPDVKTSVLGVPTSVIEGMGAISAECAAEMANGVRRLLDADVAVSVTGIAGPGGAESGKPVGTVWLALSCSSGTTCELHRFAGGREEVRRRATFRALVLLCEGIEEARGQS